MSLMDRKFGLCVINWEVENVCIATCKENWEIVSPDFYVRGQALTKWRMTLKPDPEVVDPIVSLILERLECDDKNSQKVRVSGFLSIEIEDIIQGAFPIVEPYFEIKSIVEVKLKTLSDMLQGIRILHPDVICFRCELLVCFESVEETFDTCNDLKKERLSEDLRELYENGVEYDVSVKMMDQAIPAHKSILCSRNEFFAQNIVKNPTKSVIDINDIDVMDDYGCLKKVIGFIYTGKLEYVLGKPSISIYMLADALHMTEVLEYYTPDELKLCSTVDTEEVCFTWVMNAFFLKSNDYLETPPVMMDRMGITWKLRLYPKYAQDNQYTAFCAEVYPGKTSKDICIEFAVKRGKKHFCLNRFQKTINGEEIFEYVKFVKRSTIRKYMKPGYLTTVFKFRVSTGLQESSIKNSQNAYIYALRSNYNNLCTEMKIMYTESLLSDVVIRSKTGKFKVNKCILAARSPTIYDMLKGKNYISLDIEDEVVDELLHFLYSATYKDENPSARIISEVHKAAEKLDIKCLNFFT